MSSVFDPNQQASNFDVKLVYALERVSQVFRTLLWKSQVETSLSPLQSQIVIFMYFHSDKYLSVSSFSEEFSVTKATVSDAVKVLESKKLLRKEKDIVDKRKILIKLTDEGLSLASKIEFYADPLELALKNIELDDKKVFYGVLMKIISNLNGTGLLNNLRMCTTCQHYEIKAEKPYCNLVKSFLQYDELRIDCPEHEVKFKTS